MYKSILFLSANDFKEKSIQVIRKTPEAYVEAGWSVDYIVARDNSKSGNYFYEKEINPDGVNIDRFYVPFAKLKDKISNHILQTIVSKILGLLVVIKMSYKAIKFLQKNRISIVYGYEIHGVLASKIVWLVYFGRGYRYINRFQGTWFTQYFYNKNYLKLLLNFDGLLAMRSNSNLCIMSDDGTQGDKALELIKSKSLNNFRFWVNGVDEQKISKKEIAQFKQELGLKNEEIFVSISRLEGWKRVDRAIGIISKVKAKNIKYFIIGDGYLRQELQQLVKEQNLEDKIIFVGAIPNSEVKKYLNIADYFLSMYDLSNVGNPLLEAIRANKIIFTLNNGDTSKWIEHKKNGFIYDIDDSLYESVTKDIDDIIQNRELKYTILENIKKTENQKLWTWRERMDAEIYEVERVLND